MESDEHRSRIESEAPQPRAVPASSVEPVPSQTVLEAVRAVEHPRCFVCNPENPDGLKLRFRVQADGSVVAFFPCRSVYQSYPEPLHGGITSALLDAAMTNALFSIGIVAVTAELSVRFVAPVSLDRGAVVVGTIEKTSSHPLYYVRAELQQDRKTLARATAKFLVRDAV